jgi:baseplate J-like protein
MAEGVLYLDVDDEITSAAARIRRADGSRVVLVLPYGSKVATSRINFRLLARDALTHEKRLSIVAPDGATRALAASAGLPVFASIAEYESSLEEGRGGGGLAPGAAAVAAAGIDGGEREAATAPAERETDEPAEASAAEELSPADPTVVMAVPVAAAAMSSAPATAGPAVPARPAEPEMRPATSIPVIGSSRSIPRLPLLIGVGVIALAVLVLGVGAYLLLPSAKVVVTPHEQPVGPQTFSVVADTTATEPDPDAAVVPADMISVDVSANDTFESTGVRVKRTRAEGNVTFQSFDPVRANAVPRGSVVSTEGGVEFETLAAIRLPPGRLVQGTFVVQPSSTNVAVRAVRSGVQGNVPANAITVVPRGEDPLFTKVRNPQPTSGGSRTEFPQVAQEDVDKAIVSLREQLDASFREQLSDPSIAPPDATIFDDTAVLEEPTFSVDPAELVGQELETFELGLTSTGTVLAVDPSPVESIAQSRLESFVSPGFQLVDGSVQIDPGAPIVEGQTVRFPVTVQASEVQIPDAAALKRLIMGKNEDEARSALAPFGDVDLRLWPDWVTSVPTLDARVDVEVRPPLPVEVVEPPETPTPAPPTASPSPSGQPSASPSP